MRSRQFGPAATQGWLRLAGADTISREGTARTHVAEPWMPEDYRPGFTVAVHLWQTREAALQSQRAVMPRKGREGMVRTAIVSCRIASSSATWASLLLPLPAAHTTHARLDSLLS